jgi:hypothetical protein
MKCARKFGWTIKWAVSAEAFKLLLIVIPQNGHKCMHVFFPFTTLKFIEPNILSNERFRLLLSSLLETFALLVYEVMPMRQGDGG